MFFSFQKRRIVLSPLATSKISESEYGHIFDQDLFGEIDTDACFWTLETNLNQFHLVFHLEKEHHGTRWPQLFADTDDVPETLDPSMLVNITNQLQKFASSGSLSVPNQNLTMKMIANEMNHKEEVRQWQQWSDLASSLVDKDPRLREILASNTVENDPFQPSAMIIEDEDECDHERLPVVLSSTTTRRLPGCSYLGCHGTILALQYDTDMILVDANTFKHIDTFPALGYIQASKTNRKVITLLHDDGTNPYAFILDHQNHVYVYKHITSFSHTTGAHTVLSLRSLLQRNDPVVIHGYVSLPSNRLALLTDAALLILLLQ
jgi:hypothetical protein